MWRTERSSPNYTRHTPWPLSHTPFDSSNSLLRKWSERERGENQCVPKSRELKIEFSTIAWRHQNIPYHSLQIFSSPLTPPAPRQAASFAERLFVLSFRFFCWIFLGQFSWILILRLVDGGGGHCDNNNYVSSSFFTQIFLLPKEERAKEHGAAEERRKIYYERRKARKRRVEF
jgi:hypothetical protein